jgi:predicted transcriptional regulator
MPNAFKQFFEKLTEEKAPGPSPSFSVFHLLHATELIAEKPIGRSKLAERLSVGDGTVRTIIERLRTAGLITISKEGCTLTIKGSKLWKEYNLMFKKTQIQKNELTIADYSFAILVSDRANMVKSGMEQRDAAVMAGAKGATTLKFQKGRLSFPLENRDVARDYPTAATQVVKYLSPKENDAIVIISADDPKKAEYGAMAAAWTLLD